MAVAVFASFTTMARRPRWQMFAGACSVAVALLAAKPAAAQLPQMHYRHNAAMPPGAIGSWQLQRGGPIAGYFQPVQLRSPSGAKVALAAQGRFTEPQPGLTAGFLIGQVYRLRVTSIPNFPGEEVYPTLEVIDRTYPPPGYEARFPIVVELNPYDLELALQGRFVTRVIYVEDSDRAFPVRENPHMQEWFDVRPGEDPLQVADALGRPVAILRIGGRTPSDVTQPDMRFLYGCPPFVPLPNAPAAPEPVPVQVPPQPVPEVPQGQPQLAPPQATPPADAQQSMLHGPGVMPAGNHYERPPIQNSALLPVQYRRVPSVMR